MSNRQGKFAAFAVLLLAVFALAATALPREACALTVLPECARQQMPAGAAAPAPPGLSCMLQTLTNIANLILGLMGSVTLVIFVYAGFTLITSGGEPAKVSKAKDMIRNAILGLVIILFSGAAIQYVMLKLEVKSEYKIIGARCENGGVNVQLPNGTVKECVTSCQSLGVSNMKCTKDSDGKSCLAGLCGGDAANMCCYIGN